MSIENLATKYSLNAKAEGLSPKHIGNVKLSTRLFDDFMGGVTDVSKVKADDLRRFIVALQQRRRWQ